MLWDRFKQVTEFSTLWIFYVGECLQGKADQHQEEYEMFVDKCKWKPLSQVLLFVTPWTIYSLWNSPDQNSGVGSLSLLHGIFPTQGLIPGLSHYRQILYQLSHNRSSKVVFMYSWISGSVEIIKCIDVVRCLWNAYVGFLGLPDLPLWHNLKQKELKGLSWWSGG